MANEPNFTPVPDSVQKTPGGAGINQTPFANASANGGTQMFAMGVATVIQVDYEKHEVTLRAESGESLQYVVPLTHPGAGGRHFLGTMPMPGDNALVGYGSAEGSTTRQPYVVGWFPSVTSGHDWWVTQPFAQDEHNLTPAEQVKFEGIANRVRHKMRHMLPGNVVASSGQGADLVLDEGVLLANRRGNEVRLRDQDQAFIVRSLQQFHAGAGFRVYGGIVQRDANLLPTSMFSDGTDWDAAQQVSADGTPIDPADLEKSSIKSRKLTPHPLFQRDADLVAEVTLESGFPSHLDPNEFLQNGLFIDVTGSYTSTGRGATYGGKAMYRVSDSVGANAANNANADALTEYRIEVTHTSDGTLPVTEQTDGFDADRLPSSPPRVPSPLNSSSSFVEFVLGSVVGNDPFSVPGRPLYGLPLSASVFADPAATVAVPSIGTGVGRDLGEHAAVLLRVSNPFGTASAPSFWSVTKDGRVKFSVAGPGTDFSVEGSFGSGVRLAAGRSPAGESLRLNAGGRVSVRAEKGDNTGRGVEITSGGTVLIRGAGVAGTTIPTGKMSEPGLTLQSDTDALIKASGAVIFSAQSVNFQDTAVLGFSAGSGLALKAGDSISQVSKTSDKTTMGKSVESFSGPKDGLPTNGAVREVNITATPLTGFAGGTSDKYSNVYGDRFESFTAGSHTTSVVVGNATYMVGTGTWTASAGSNSVVIGTATGVAVTATTGVATFAAAAGAVSINGSTAVVVTSQGPVAIKGTAVILTALGKSAGGIICGSDLDTLSGIPLSLRGLGSTNHLLLSG